MLHAAMLTMESYLCIARSAHKSALVMGLKRLGAEEKRRAGCQRDKHSIILIIIWLTRCHGEREYDDDVEHERSHVCPSSERERELAIMSETYR